MLIILITYPQFIKNEAFILNSLFINGLQNLHIRKPGAQVSEYRSLIENIDSQFYSRIIIHDFPELISEFGLKGFHFNRSNLNLHNNLNINCLYKSYSAHTFNEIIDYQDVFDYIFLSPVYQSISKENYFPVLRKKEIGDFFNNNILNTKVIALGGIDVEKINEVYILGFQGFALLGTIWETYLKTKNIELVIKLFKNIKEKCNQVVHTF